MQDILTLLKQLLPINVNTTDVVLNFYITKAINAIKGVTYLSEDDIKTNLINQTTELTLYYYQNAKTLGLKNSSEGSKSRTFEDNAIPNSIKATLPHPAIYSM